MRINVDFGMSIYEIEFKPFLGNDINKYYNIFCEWYYEPREEIVEGNKYISYSQRKDLPYEVFDIQPILDWMKECSQDSNPKVLNKFLPEEEYDKTLPIMYF